jgi:hypothetical protein
MANVVVDDLEVQLQASLNCLEMCRAFHKQTKDPDVKATLEPLMDDLQDSLASMAGQLRARGVATGTFQLDDRGQARVREVLGTRSLSDQLLAVRECLAGLVVWYDDHSSAGQAHSGADDWLVSLSAQAHSLLERWDRHLKEMKAAL